MAGKAQVGNYPEVIHKYQAITSGVATWQGQELDFGVSSRDMVAVVLNRLQIVWNAYGLGFDSACQLGFGLFGKNPNGGTIISTVNASNSLFVYSERYMSAAAAGQDHVDPQILDFGMMPGGGLIMPARGIYTGVWATNLAADTNILLTLVYQLVELDQASMLDLIQALQGI